MNRKLIVVAMLISMSLLCLTGQASAASYSVPGDFNTIQEAITAAPDNSVITVGPGVYNENLSFSGKTAITIKASAGPASTVIDGGGIASVATFDLTKSGCLSHTIDGFTLRNGYSATNGGAVNITGTAKVNVLNSRIMSNTAAFGGAFSVSDSGSLTVNTCVVDNNSAVNEGGAFYLAAGRLSLGNSTVTRNIAPLGGSIKQMSGASISGTDNVIYGNIDASGNPSPPVFFDPSGVVIQFSDVETSLTGTVSGNINADPKFVDAQTGNYQLSAGSPAIDSGITYLPTDFLGVTRPQGSATDMGAYEYVAVDTAPPTVTATSPANGATNAAVSNVITVTFNENIKAGSAIGSIKRDKIYQFDYAISGNVLTLTVRSCCPSITAGKTYTVSIPAGAVTDLAGNAMDAYAFSFTTANPVKTYTIVASAGTGSGSANGTISPSGTISISSGASASFSISPNSGYGISAVYVDGVSVGAVSSYTFSNVTANHTISATFAANTTVYTIVASAGTGSAAANGTISPSGTITVSAGGSQTFTITPNAGYKVLAVLVDGVPAGAVSSYTFSSVSANHSIKAIFAPQAFSIIASAGTGSAAANGTISPSGRIILPAGGSQTFTITPNNGFQISMIFVDGTAVGALSSYTFPNVSANHSIRAFFVKKATTYNIVASAGTGSASANGTISPSGTVSVSSGASVSFVISPNTGYAVSAVTVDSVSVGAVTSYTFSNVTANHTINATFAASDATPPTVVSTSPANGSTNAPVSNVLAVAFSENIKAGTAINSIRRDKQYEFTYSISGGVLTLTVKSCCPSIVSGKTYTVSLPAGAVTDLAGNPMSAYSFSFTTL
jgi:methionine-rich copper-binding protein CopC